MKVVNVAHTKGSGFIKRRDWFFDADAWKWSYYICIKSSTDTKATQFSNLFRSVLPRYKMHPKPSGWQSINQSQQRKKQNCTTKKVVHKSCFNWLVFKTRKARDAAWETVRLLPRVFLPSERRAYANELADAALRRSATLGHAALMQRFLVPVCS